MMLIFCISAKSQIKFEANTRSSKVDTVFDYFFGVGITDTVFCNYEVSIFGSYERDRGTVYHQYRGSISHKFGKVSHITDTEKDIHITSLNLFISKSIFRFGGDLSYTDEFIYGAYLGVKYKFISLETAFNEEFYKFQYTINPQVTITDNLKIGIIIKGIFIEYSLKWQNGATITILL